MTFTDIFYLVCLIIFIAYFIAISALAVYQTKRDKQLSARKKDSYSYWRIPESQLLFIAALGGSFAMYAAMQKYRHKTKHPKFMVGLPLIMLLQILLAAAILWLEFCW